MCGKNLLSLETVASETRLPSPQLGRKVTCVHRYVRVWFLCHFTVLILFLGLSYVSSCLCVLKEVVTESMIKGFTAELLRALIEHFTGF